MSWIQKAMSSVSSTFRPEEGSSSSSSFGLGAQRARQFDHLAHAVGQAGDHRVAVVLQVEEVDDLLDLLRARATSARRAAPVNSRSCQQAGAAVRVAADQQVLQHGGVLEQLDVLEGARDAQRGDRVRRLRDQVLAVEAGCCRRWACRCG